MEPECTEQIRRYRALIASGQLRRGMTRDEVRVLLGPPDDVGLTSRKYRTPQAYLYGCLQLLFGPRAGDGLLIVYRDAPEGEESIYLMGGSDPTE
jgi:hypothetical protein